MLKESIFSIICANIVNILPEYVVDSINIQDSLHALGANSIDRADIIMNTVEEIGVKVRMLEFAEAQNISDIVEIIYRNINAQS